MARVLVSGSSGFVGTALCKQLEHLGYSVLRLVRKPSSAPDEVYWNIEQSQIQTEKINGISAVIHLAGENIAAGRWTEDRKALIRNSRVMSTNLLAQTLANLPSPPAVFVSASAVGIYGDRGDQLCTEETVAGQGFLAETAIAWEAATQAARSRGIRVVTPRIGVVIDWKGGALQRMRTPFILGVGGRLGSGKQYMSWISLVDLVNLIIFCVENKNVNGAVNAVAPTPVTNAQFTSIVAKNLNRPALFPVPAWALRLLLGEFADAALLSSTRVSAAKAVELGFNFTHKELAQALE
jgi:uncharacterized protein (TIGR01777 family)